MHGTLRGGNWTRAGRGDCEIWSLHLGDLVRTQVVRGPRYEDKWKASFNMIDLGAFTTRDDAMQRVEATILHNMSSTLGDWIKFQVGTKRPKR